MCGRSVISTEPRKSEYFIKPFSITLQPYDSLIKAANTALLHSSQFSCKVKLAYPWLPSSLMLYILNDNVLAYTLPKSKLKSYSSQIPFILEAWQDVRHSGAAVQLLTYSIRDLGSILTMAGVYIVCILVSMYIVAMLVGADLVGPRACFHAVSPN